jgi:hypothetical protein
MSANLALARARIGAAVALLQQKARLCRRAASVMDPSPARTAVERIALCWEIMAEAERRGDAPRPANEA